jgi:O-antigen/teichoic acid export membrane protein
MSKWTFTVNLPLFLILQLFPGVILSIFGREYAGGATALLLLAWGNLVDATTGICGVVLDMTGKTGLKLVNTIVASGLLLGLNLLLTPRYGLVGAALASATANAGVNLLRVAEVYVLYRLLPYNASFLKPVAAGIVALGAGWVTSQSFLTEETLVFTLIHTVVLVGVYAAAILLLGLDREDRTVLRHISGSLQARFRRASG